MPPDTKNRDESEWSRFYRLPEFDSLEVLHAPFVSHRYVRHVHDYLVVGLVERGTQSYWYRGARHVTPPGRIFLVSPGEPHTGEAASPEGYVYRTICLQEKHLARWTQDMGRGAGRTSFRAAVLHDRHLAALLTSFHRCIREQAPALESESFLLQAMARMLTCHSDDQAEPKPAGRERPAIARARDYIDSHYADDVSLSRLAELASLSPFYFARAFRSETGLPLHLYLENVRIRRIRAYVDRGAPRGRAAAMAGYSDQSHLTRRFKRFLRITPGQYVRQAGIRRDGRSSGDRRGSLAQ